jgi:hypothetical protein
MTEKSPRPTPYAMIKASLRPEHPDAVVDVLIETARTYGYRIKGITLLGMELRGDEYPEHKYGRE